MDSEVGNLISFNRLLTDWLVQEYPGKDIRVGGYVYSGSDAYHISGHAVTPKREEGISCGRIVGDVQVGNIEIGWTAKHWSDLSNVYTPNAFWIIGKGHVSIADPNFFPELKQSIDKRLKEFTWTDNSAPPQS